MHGSPNIVTDVMTHTVASIGRRADFKEVVQLMEAGAVTAEELMTSPALTVHANATLAQAARIMARVKVKRLPVVDDTGRLEGVVSRGDLLKVFPRDDEEVADEVRGEVVS